MYSLNGTKTFGAGLKHASTKQSIKEEEDKSAKIDHKAPRCY